MARSHVTNREAQAIVDYAVNLCAALHLPGWTINLQVDPCEDDANASIRQLEGRWLAQLWVSSDWMKLDYDERRQHITHEVLHLLHFPVSDVVLEDSKTYMHPHEHADWERRVRRQFELMVDHLASWMADTHSLKEAWDAAHGKG